MRYRNRHLENRLSRLRRSFPSILVTGARQSGKSTLLTQMLPEAEHLVFDPVIDVGGARSDPELFLRQHHTPIVLDEVQYVPELMSVIKRWIDKEPSPGQYFLTGSQNLMALRSVSESMAGRVAVLDLPFLSLAERCDAGGRDAEGWFADMFRPDGMERLRGRGLLPQRDREPTLHARLWRGGFPRALDLDDEVLPDLFESYLRTYVERDVRQLAVVEDQHTFSRFVSLCAALTSQEINHSQLGRELGISYQTAQRWLAVLVASYQWVEVPAWHGNAVKRVSRRPKGFFADTGFASWLQRISSPTALGGHPLQGALFETQVVLEVIKQSQTMAPSPRAWYWRSHGGAEVDLLLERDGVFVAVEAKSASRVTRADARGIIAFRQTYPEMKHGLGIVIAAIEEAQVLGDDIIAIPYDIA